MKLTKSCIRYVHVWKCECVVYMCNVRVVCVHVQKQMGLVKPTFCQGHDTPQDL